MPIPNTKLPDDFVEQILKCTRVGKPTLRDALDEAILTVLHRPLTSQEQWAIIDHMDKISIDEALDGAGEHA